MCMKTMVENLMSTLTNISWHKQGLEQLQSGLLQQHSPLLPLSQPSQQLQLQQQIQMLLGDQYMGIRNDMQSNYMTNMVPDANLPVQVALPLFSRADDTLMKVPFSYSLILQLWHDSFSF